MRLSHKIFQFFLISIFTICLISGIVFRFGNLSQKLYWEDEVYTSTRISGYTQKMITKEIDGKVTPLLELNRYRDVKLGKNWLQAMISIASRPEQAPLYYVMARGWAEMFGSSVWSMRFLPALISLLALPCFYWLSLELFKSPMVAATTVALASLSPILIRYSQEARPYSCWIVATLLLHIFFLRAIRLQTKKSWLFYSFTVTLTMLTQLISGLILIVHGIYITLLFLVVENKSFARLKKLFHQEARYSIAWSQLKQYFQSLAIGLIPTIPWFIIIIIRWSSIKTVTEWQNTPITIGKLINSWGSNLSHLLFSWSPENNNLEMYLTISILMLISWSSYQLIKYKNIKISVFLLITIILYSGVFIGKDLILGGILSRMDRYFLPVYIILLIIIGYALGNQLIRQQTKTISLKISAIVTIFILIIAWQSCFYNLQAKSWWGLEISVVEISEIISKLPQPMIISNERIARILSLCYNLNTDAKLQFFSYSYDLNNINIETTNLNNLLLYNPSSQLLSQFHKLLSKDDEPLKLIYEKNYNILWSISPHAIIKSPDLN